MSALDQASNTFPFAPNFFNQMGYHYVPGDDMSDEDESQIMADLKAIAEYGAPMTAPHGFVEHCDLLEFWDCNKEEIFSFIFGDYDGYFDRDIEEEIEGEFGLTRNEAVSLECGRPTDEKKKKIIWRLLETVANYVCFDTDAHMC